MSEAVQSDMFRKSYAEVFDGDERWNTLEVPTGDSFAWDDGSTYVRRPPFFEQLPPEPEPVTDIESARVLAVLGDSVTTDHISPAGSIKRESPAGAYLIDHGVEAEGLQLLRFATRQSRGDDAGDLRQHPAAQPARTRDRGRSDAVPRRRGRAEQMSIYDASMRYSGAGRPADRARRQGIRLGLVTRLGGQGNPAARRAGGDRAELRAHPPLQPGRHGRAATPVQGRRLGRVARSHGPGDVHASAAWPTRTRSRARSPCGPTRRSSRSPCGSTRRRSSATSTTEASCSSCCGSFSRRERSRSAADTANRPLTDRQPDLGGRSLASNACPPGRPGSGASVAAPGRH